MAFPENSLVLYITALLGNHIYFVTILHYANTLSHEKIADCDHVIETRTRINNKLYISHFNKSFTPLNDVIKQMTEKK